MSVPWEECESLVSLILKQLEKAKAEEFRSAQVVGNIIWAISKFEDPPRLALISTLQKATKKFGVECESKDMNLTESLKQVNIQI